MSPGCGHPGASMNSAVAPTLGVASPARSGSVAAMACGTGATEPMYDARSRSNRAIRLAPRGGSELLIAGMSVPRRFAEVVVCGARRLGPVERWLRNGLRRGKARHGEAELQAISPLAGWVRYLNLGPASDTAQRSLRRRAGTDRWSNLRPFALRRPAREHRDNQEKNERPCEENIHDRCDAHVELEAGAGVGRRSVCPCMPCIGRSPANQKVLAQS